MEILVVPDKFKGSLSSREAGEAVARGVRAAARAAGVAAEVCAVPVSDGGEGTLDVVEAYLPVKRLQTECTDPLGRPMMADLLFDGSTRTAYLEAAACTGLWLLDPRDRNPLHTTSWGLGELIRFARTRLRAERIVLGLGGTATSDGGAGMAGALGYRLYGADNVSRCWTGRENVGTDADEWLLSMAGVDSGPVSRCVPGLREFPVDVACDVQNPLTGPQGAAQVFAPQKGASPEAVLRLETAMRHWADVAEGWGSRSGLTVPPPAVRWREVPGAGAAGGLGFALLLFCGARLRRGWEMMAEIVSLEERIREADLVITGEGSFDASSLQGKLPFGVADLCRRYGKPLLLFCGRSRVPAEAARTMGLAGVYSLAEVEPDVRVCVAHAASLLEFLAARSVEDWLSDC